MIAERQKTSVFWAVIHILGSLKLALVLLATIALACAIATFYESSFNAIVAQAYIYKAPWFTLWLVVLCINLAAATLTRWPWQSKHTGFVITHAGIIVLLIGGMVGSNWGFEASVNLHVNRPPVDRLVINETILQVDSPLDSGIYIMPIQVEVRRPTEDSPKTLPLPGTRSKLVVREYHESVGEKIDYLVADAGSAAEASVVELTFASQMMGQEVPVQLIYERETHAENGQTGHAHAHGNFNNVNDFFGLAQIELLNSVEEDIPETAHDHEHILETQVVFAKAGPVIHPMQGDQPTGVEMQLVETEEGWLVKGRHPSAGEYSFSVEELRGEGKKVGNMTMVLRDFWNDFVMREGKPASASEEPNNPAVLVQLLAPSHAALKPQLKLAIQEDGTVAYRILRHGEVVNEGSVKVGEAIVPGWADWAATVRVALPKVNLTTRLAPVENVMDEDAGVPAILVQLKNQEGELGERTWIRSGRSEEIRVGNEFVRIGFGLKTQRIPFTIGLKSFEVPRDEGTDSPADYISTVVFTDVETGEAVERVSRMNHPASYPGGFWRVTTGYNYKFSQASWNPDDLGETTLQVLYDPGWLWKWIGSLMMTCGVGIMFYFKPYTKKKETP